MQSIVKCHVQSHFALCFIKCNAPASWKKSCLTTLSRVVLKENKYEKIKLLLKWSTL